MQAIKNTITLLRFPFSLFLLPNFLFAFSQAHQTNSIRVLFVCFILHLLVYPASNGYNSYMDRDTGSIGGIKNPPPPNRLLLYTTAAMDILALTCAYFVSIYFLTGVFIYILFSRLYSYRAVRLKKYPVPGFLTVFLIQGAVTYAMIFEAIDGSGAPLSLYALAASSCLIGALYPLTQIYQHNQDKADDVRTLSYVLGYRGTFIFSAVLFVLASVFLYLHFSSLQQLQDFYIVQACLLPALLFFFYWAYKVEQHEAAANFRNTMYMNIIAALCTSIAFVVIS